MRGPTPHGGAAQRFARWFWPTIVNQLGWKTSKTKAGMIFDKIHIIAIIFVVFITLFAVIWHSQYHINRTTTGPELNLAVQLAATREAIYHSILSADPLLTDFAFNRIEHSVANILYSRLNVPRHVCYRRCALASLAVPMWLWWISGNITTHTFFII